MLLRWKDKMLVDLVEYDIHVVLCHELSNEFQFLSRKDLARRVVRRVEQ